MRTTKLSDFLKQQGLTPDGNKTVYQAFIDNWGPSQLDVWVKNGGSEITAAFVWSDTQEGVYFWRKIDEKWINNMGKSENDMLWLLESKESPEETDRGYPRWFQSKSDGTIVKFDSLCGGTVIYGGDKRLFREGLYGVYWYPHYDTEKWQEVPNPELIQEQKRIVDKPKINSYFNLEITKEHEKNMMKDQDGIDMISEVFKIEINIETNSGYTKNEYLRQKIDKFLAEIKQLKDY
jgi:hypothetical protein